MITINLDDGADITAGRNPGNHDFLSDHIKDLLMLFRRQQVLVQPSALVKLRRVEVKEQIALNFRNLFPQQLNDILIVNTDMVTALSDSLNPGDECLPVKSDIKRPLAGLIPATNRPGI